MRRILIILAAFVVVLVPSAAAAQEYPVQTGTLSVSTASVAPGGTIQLSGTGFAPGATVQITLNSDPVDLGSTEADATGTISTTVTIPENTAPGTHTLTATGEAAGGGTLVLSAEIVVTGDSGRDSSLPLTGAGLAVSLAIVGIGGIAGGGFLLTARRRRSHAS